jgi:hypothetical protein
MGTEKASVVKLEAGEELVLTAGIKGCTIMYEIVEGEINTSIASELLRLRQLERALSRGT